MKYLFVIILIFLSLIILTGCSINVTETNFTITDDGSLDVFFCPEDDCEGEFLSFLDSAQESVHCALFEVSLDAVQLKLTQMEQEIDVKVIVDDTYYKRFTRDFVKQDSYGLMHNKFCVVDGKRVLTGSMNPTENGARKNNNNVIIIDSKVFANSFSQEFDEMWEGTFKKGERTGNSAVKLGDISVDVLFCPEDHCANRVELELEKAETSIYFMAFAFTHQGIANRLLLKDLDGLDVRGVMEARMAHKFSQYPRINYSTIEIVKDANKNTQHNKVFIIDEETVITGSFNPSQGADTKNDENLVIIKNKEIAQRYLAEFEKIYTLGKNKI